jgi:hypothetical protein
MRSRRHKAVSEVLCLKFNEEERGRVVKIFLGKSGKVHGGVIPLSKGLSQMPCYFFINIDRKKEEVKMKKIICFLAVALMIASIAFAAEMITQKDLPALKGTWEGMLSWGISGAANSNAKLEILNDSVPVKAKFSLTNVPEKVAKDLLSTMGTTASFESDEGLITTQGTLMFIGPEKNFLEFTKAGGKLSGSYYFRGVKGNTSLKKK